MIWGLELVECRPQLRICGGVTFGLASPEDGEEEGEADLDEVGRVLLRPVRREVLQQLVDHRDHLALVGRLQSLEPGVQGPRDAQVAQVQGQVQVGGLAGVVHGLLQLPHLDLGEPAGQSRILAIVPESGRVDAFPVRR